MSRNLFYWLLLSITIWFCGSHMIVSSIRISYVLKGLSIFWLLALLDAPWLCCQFIWSNSESSTASQKRLMSTVSDLMVLLHTCSHTILSVRASPSFGVRGDGHVRSLQIPCLFVLTWSLSQEIGIKSPNASHEPVNLRVFDLWMMVSLSLDKL